VLEEGEDPLWQFCSLDEFEGKRIVGEGTYGKVYEVTHVKTQKKYAMKKIRFFERQGKPGVKPMVLREISFLQEVSHPCIVKLKGAFLKKASVRLIFEFFEADLYKAVHSGFPFSPDEVRVVMRRLLRAMSHIHSLGIVHRDVKASNLLLAERGELCLCDFGFARRRLLPEVEESERKRAIEKINSDVFHDDIESSLDRFGGSQTTYADDPYLHVDEGEALAWDERRAELLASSTARELTCTISHTFYKAPEVILGCHTYGAPTDMWAVGVVMSELLNEGKLIMEGNGDIAQLDRIFDVRGRPAADEWPEAQEYTEASMFDFSEPLPKKELKSLLRPSDALTDAAVDLLDRLLEVKSTQRITADEALKHPFFEGADDLNDEEVLKGLFVRLNEHIKEKKKRQMGRRRSSLRSQYGHEASPMNRPFGGQAFSGFSPGIGISPLPFNVTGMMATPATEERHPGLRLSFGGEDSFGQVNGAGNQSKESPAVSGSGVGSPPVTRMESLLLNSVQRSGSTKRRRSGGEGAAGSERINTRYSPQLEVSGQPTRLGSANGVFESELEEGASKRRELPVDPSPEGERGQRRSKRDRLSVGEQSVTKSFDFRDDGGDEEGGDGTTGMEMEERRQE